MGSVPDRFDYFEEGRLTEKPSPYPKFHPYLTIVPGRRPEQKTHTSLGHAKNAMLIPCGYTTGYIVRGGQIWEYDSEGGEWAMIYEVAPGTLESQVPWKKDA